ncbi:sulfotransferase [Gracilimonas mengyeensis]|uniref:Sulfotransferase family protein n=1 Tax=Gracilimonas mengyeensis TaxID=1302730 RepID=A0A521CLH8_9BACT|nr:sulfotransferase [Gracilimonas mengyeensis]SMO60278.1 hypothetical protein SAMN06265219_1066 [Gracilimonas mengyeensis]
MQQITTQKLWSESWFPEKIKNNQVYWKMMGDKRFTEPFYEDTMGCVDTDERSRMQTSLDIFEKLPPKPAEVLKPSAFIFHVSRCGSTLLAQMLSAISENLVISEAPVIDQLLKSNLSEKVKNNYLKNLVAWLCRKRFGNQKHAFLKMDAWHLLHMDRFRKVFPEASFIAMYRNPKEVLQSHHRKRGQHMIPGFFEESIMPIEARDYANMDQHAGKVLQKYMQSISEWDKEIPLTMLNYSSIQERFWAVFTKKVAVSWTTGHKEKMLSRARYYSKNKRRVFEGDRPECSNFMCPKNIEELQVLYRKLKASTA